MPRVSEAYEQTRRHQILVGAATCFAHGGFSTTSMPEIADAAGLSVGALYRYFSSKEDLFLAVVAERVAVYNVAVFAALDRPGHPVERLQGALRSLQRLLNSQSPDDARLSLELWVRAHDVPALGAWLREARHRRIEALRSVIEAGRRTSCLRAELRTNDAVAALMAAADGLVVQRACAPFERTIGNPLNEVERLITSWQAGPRAASGDDGCA
ncbi:MAG: TetR/AcrR family transcriptional regulator [Chloroflexi bacterium]|nr:TetR/AcrR family transcriptional regulator [Chloroflexota bacterium]